MRLEGQFLMTDKTEQPFFKKISQKDLKKVLISILNTE